MNFNIKKLFRLTLISLFFVLTAYSSADKSTSVDDEKSTNIIYDIELKGKGGTISYSGSVRSKEPAGFFMIDDEGHNVLTLSFNDEEDLQVIAFFMLDENDVPYPIDYQNEGDGIVSLISIIDADRSGFFAGAAGSSAVVSDLQRVEAFGLDGFYASYTVEFSGVFHHSSPSGEIIEYECTGKVVLPPLK